MEEESRPSKRRGVEESAGVVGVASDDGYDIIFRSYTPRDVKLQPLKREQSEVPDMVGEINTRVAALTSRRNEDVLSLAPKKAAWDLARDLQPKVSCCVCLLAWQKICFAVFFFLNNFFFHPQLARLAQMLDRAVVLHLQSLQKQIQ
jgi:hypothetical protein